MTATHPRPQLARDGWRSLNGAWQYAPDAGDLGLRQRWWDDPEAFTRQIQVPFPPESQDSGIGEDTGSVHWYRRELLCDVPAPGRRVYLRFEAVDYESDVWVNGQHVAHHRGGFTPFGVDITDVLASSGRQTVVVRARDDQHDLEQPRGKQDWQDEPHVIWYRRTSGIWREVWLEEVAQTHVAALRLDPDPVTGVVQVEVEVVGTDGAAADVDVRLTHEGRILASAEARVFSGRATLGLVLREAVANATLEELWWTPERPVLLDVAVNVTVDTTVLDTVHSYVGLRSVDTDAHSFLLNDQPYFLRMVLEQAYWPTSHLAAPSQDALRVEAQLIKDLGFNGLRMHQTTADPRFLAWCDRIGLLVWVDSPASFRFSERSLGRTIEEWTQIVARDRNHPSVCTWVPFNESWGIEQVSVDQRQRHAVMAVHHMLRALDGSRPTLGNDGWEYVTGDIVGVHDYRHDAAALQASYDDVDELAVAARVSGRRVVVDDRAAQRRAGGKPVVLSEFGGFTLAPDEGTWQGYGSVADGEELLSRVASVCAAVNSARGLAGFCYTQLTDTEQERNGLLTEDRRPKAKIESIARAVAASIPGPA